ncbi:MAG: molybdopterin molybdotransferase MoeA [Rudaea sp.]
MTEAGASFPIGLSVQEARERIVEIAKKYIMPAETVALESAFGRVLAADIVAPCDVPGFANSAMDGFALRGADLSAAGDKAFRLIGEILAGGHRTSTVIANTCVRITTGAPLPDGADTVVMKENARVDGDRILIAAGTASGANARRAGEDYRAGDVALKRGTRLTPAQVSVLASFGFAMVNVTSRPRVVLLTTGDELTAPGDTLASGHIYDSNRYSLGGLLAQHGVELLRHERIGDDPESLRDAVRRAGADSDIIVSSGGVSAGEADFLPRVIVETGMVHFWKVRIKPGWPFLFGQVGQALMFALPGNPVSGIATFATLLKPGLDALTGAHIASPGLRARLRLAISKRHARTEFRRARIECDAEGRLWAMPHAQQGSGMLRGVSEAHALIMLQESPHEFAAGDVVDILPLPGWPV